MITSAMVRVISRFMELHQKLPEADQDPILLASAQMVVDFIENNPVNVPMDPESINIMFELWCVKKNFDLDRHTNRNSGVVSYKDSRTRRAWYAVRDLVEVITEAQEKVLS